jgi:BirA family biotin operon repressor/biotin-[acetyl-CoA-carboxylase] ligase
VARANSGDPVSRSGGETELTGRSRTWDDAALQRALDAAGTDGWGPVAVLPSTGSTNADAAEQAREGCPEGFTVVADEQSSGRGRLDRVWESPSGAGLAMSVVLRPTAPSATWGWVPLLAGVAVVDALGRQGMAAGLKWPNDVVVDGPAHDGSDGPRKLGGLLVERVAEADALVVGIGINTDLRSVELPVARATSTRLERVDVSREQLLVDILDELRRRTSAWSAGAGDARRTGLLDAYEQRCLTLRRDVRVLLPGGDVLGGRATGVDDSGRLVVRSADGRVQAVSAGDVEHVR